MEEIREPNTMNDFIVQTNKENKMNISFEIPLI